MLKPSIAKVGAPAISKREEEEMISEHVVFAEKRDFAVGKDILESLMQQVASDC